MNNRNYQFDLLAVSAYPIIMLMDMHVHTTASPCSTLALEQILIHGKRLGLDGVCITDHDTTAASRWLETLGARNGMTVIVGMEYATDQGDLLLFGPDLDLPSGMEAEEVLAHIRSAGGAAILAHPCRKARPGDETLAESGLVSIVEAVNGRNSPEENAGVYSWLARYPLRAVAGSDAHALDELGKAATYFARPVRDWKDLAAALGAGDMAPLLPLQHPAFGNVMAKGLKSPALPR